MEKIASTSIINKPRLIIENIIPIIAKFFLADFMPVIPKINAKIATKKEITHSWADILHN